MKTFKKIVVTKKKELASKIKNNLVPRFKSAINEQNWARFQNSISSCYGMKNTIRNNKSKSSREKYLEVKELFLTLSMAHKIINSDYYSTLCKDRHIRKLLQFLL